MLIALFDNICLEKTEQEEKSAGGVFLPEMSRAESQEARIVNIGPFVQQRNLQPGMRVIFNKYSGAETKIDGERYLLIRERDVLGLVSDAPFEPV